MKRIINKKNEMKKIISITIFSLLLCGNMYSQNETKELKNALGVSGGTGIGFDYSRALKIDKWYVSLGYNSLNYTLEGYEQKISGEDLLVDATLDFKSIDLKISYHPFSNAFKIVGGFGFFSSSNTNIKTTFKDSILVGEIEFNAEDIGSLDINIDWSDFAPYLGIGFGRAVSKKGFGIALDLGTYFSSSPQINLNATGLIEETKDQENLLNESFESFKFIPFAALRIAYSF